MTTTAVDFTMKVTDDMLRLGDMDAARAAVEASATDHTPPRCRLENITLTTSQDYLAMDGVWVRVRATAVPLPMPLLWEGDQA